MNLIQLTNELDLLFLRLSKKSTTFSNMGDLKDAGQAGDGANAPTQENMETVEIGNPPSEQDLEHRNLLVNAEMAALMTNPYL
ncbi:hypothetical protein CDAR_237021 [Caerostris darwini]|uniref:Uncharacterized protein n=1 Tax=Caerostris darwini TaxID=1538125 RepID=A0AAV4VZN4_9ARAC|nr:hypothetical protein CDAR_237021 [Caerostris darwini]